ncbi:hypothetical protein GCWU000282_01838 [Catonella morbi ATCC 51271]|uniref:Uncharacterized protein n=1 Tax=Catonella morbi ATCC 51271 TaxID=592026 RepID=V2Y4E9_9FIRM|nr:hypothetical protein GCWU000282_01838 [Catonella morbi ATCC 51271]
MKRMHCFHPLSGFSSYFLNFSTRLSANGKSFHPLSGFSSYFSDTTSQ